MKSTLNRTNRFGKPVPLDSTQRSAKVSKQHELYRKKFMEEIRAAINDTDYLVTMANDSPAQMYLSQTGRHKPAKITNIELPTDPEEIDRLKFKDPTSPRILSYRKRSSTSSSHRRYDIERLSEDEPEEVEIIAKPLNLSPEKDSMTEEEQRPENEVEEPANVVVEEEEDIVNDEQENAVVEEEDIVDDELEPQVVIEDPVESVEEEEILERDVILGENEEEDTLDDNSDRAVRSGSIKDVDVSIVSETYAGKTWREIIDDSDDLCGDNRPSNCGMGPDNTAELVYEVPVSELTITEEEFEKIKNMGFGWLLLTGDVSGSLEQVRSIAKHVGLLVMTDFCGTESLAYVDGVRCDESQLGIKNENSDLVCIGSGSASQFTYVSDSTPYDLMRAGDGHGFDTYVTTYNPEQRMRLVRETDDKDLIFNDKSLLTALVSVMMLPGMRIIKSQHLSICESLTEILTKKSVWRGVMTPLYASETTHGNITFWKYTRDRQHILVCVNFHDSRACARVLCEDAPEPAVTAKSGKIPFWEMMTDTTYMRNANEVRTQGLCVILEPYQMQIFEY